MADNSSNSVAIVAIVIIVIVAVVGFWYFINHGGMKTTSDTTKVEVTLPASDTAPAKSN
ncbi:MAG: hypothetical protein ABI597_08655 [Gammaproteobacteria bacterium]